MEHSCVIFIYVNLVGGTDCTLYDMYDTHIQKIAWPYFFNNLQRKIYVYESEQVKLQLKPDLFIKGQILEISWEPATILNVTHKQMSMALKLKNNGTKASESLFG
jgi:hypothetical protein